MTGSSWRSAVDLGDPDRLGALPQAAPTHLAEPVLPVVARPSPTTEAKWFAANCPTFEAVVHPPYGKKTSHSLMPPG